jgi:hypothetical protein
MPFHFVDWIAESMKQLVQQFRRARYEPMLRESGKSIESLGTHLFSRVRNHLYESLYGYGSKISPMAS